MIDSTNTALVLEGGGMRGVFTAGVLDSFLNNNIWFPYTIAVSAGASNGLSYISNQKGRSYFSNIELPKIHPYIGIKSFLKGKGFFDLDFLFYEYPDKYYPFDYDTFFNSYILNSRRFVMVVSNCLTGKAEYLEEYKDKQRLLEICKASCTLPFNGPLSYVDKIPMLDGGVCDAVPVEQALKEGYKKLVIVLTRNKGYRKDEKEVKIPHFIYSKYPKIREALISRSIRYNQTMDLIDKLELEGVAKVIRPIEPIVVDRVEKNVEKLKDLYNKGLEAIY